MMVIGENWLNIERLHDGKYRVITRAGTELAAKFSRETAHIVCCALCVHELDPGLRNESPVWFSIIEGKYKVTRPGYTPEWHEIRIGTVADVRSWHAKLNKESNVDASIAKLLSS